ncbi:MAG TPA: M50 family metallopeptidase [Kofleriaceae bacterium]|nr:M50 family metallopeptidase [Kofleriaceae bacterium]
MLWIGGILAIGLLIVVHEAGHFVVARWCKMRVDTFSIGFGPGIFKRKRGDTEFQLAPIPFGGYVAIAGMNVGDEVDRDDLHAYPNRPVWQRFLTIFAGPGTNYLFAALIAFGLYSVTGIPSGATEYWTVSAVSEGFDAAGKLEPGDRVVAIDGEKVYARLDGKEHTDLPAVIDAHGENAIEVTVLRAGEPVTVSVLPKLDNTISEKNGGPRYRLGVAIAGVPDVTERVDVGIGGAAKRAVIYPVAQTALIIDHLGDLISGDAGLDSLGGPVKIVSATKQAFDRGWIWVLQLLMFLNVSLGLINLLPLPALDGGRLVFLGYEMATRRRANPKVEATVHMVGVMALLVLMVLVTWNDIATVF